MITGVGQVGPCYNVGKTERRASVLVQVADFLSLLFFVPSTMYFVNRVLILESEMDQPCTLMDKVHFAFVFPCF